MDINIMTANHNGRAYYDYTVEVDSKCYEGVCSSLECAFEGIMETLRFHEERKNRRQRRTEY